MSQFRRFQIKIKNTRVESTNVSDPSIAFRVLRALLARSIRTGRLRVIDVLGGIHDFGGGSSERVCVRFQKSSAYWKLLLNPDLYLGEAYMNGEITIEEGSIADFLEVVLKNVPSQGGFVTPTTSALNAFDFCIKRFRQINTPLKSRENVGHHYDLSSDLYKLFLDQEWQYSCGYYSSGSETLEEAQKSKMQYILTKLLINKDHHVLDIGCGWGGLARYIARETGARVTGITLSREQLDYAENKTREEGLSHLVKFKLCDYRNLKGVYDRIVSVGMFEHVGVDCYQTFFQTIRKLMGREGVALLHSIGRSTIPTTTNPWIKKYIFPGGYIPALSEVIPHVERSGLFMTDLEVLRLHYAKTINEWRERFEEQRERAQSIYDERFCRMWEFYLASSEASFKYSGNMVFHMQLAGQQEAVPLTRSYLYEDISV
ncbi:MAG: cyclopropane-fatty-acyl-phospholipid synthase [Bacteriovorax sp.]|nr:cyclopropane-fatty-acyl-phospholipid synthase [Bacteriovorax sp.]